MITVTRIQTSANLRLHWSEWIPIAIFSVTAVAVSVEGILLAAATAWFGDPSQELLPLPALIVAFFGAALVMRLAEDTAALRPLARGFMALGMIITALLLIRLYVFPTLPAGDWSWLASFANLTNLYDAQPHAELGMMVMSVVAWILGGQLARNAGDFDKRRAAFIGLFIVLIFAILVGVASANGSNRLVSQMALLLPAYLFLGLLMMAQVRLADLRARLAQGGASLRSTLRVWRVSSAGMAFAYIALVLILIAIFYNGAYVSLFQALSSAWVSFADVVANVLGWLGTPLIILFSNLGRRRGTSSTTSTPPQGKFPTNQAQALTHTQVQINYAIALGIVLLVVIALIIFYFSSRRAKAPTTEIIETREALVPEVEKLAASAPAPADQWGLPGSNTVRAAYRAFLQRGARAGMEREPDETPEEYAGRLAPPLGIAGSNATEGDLATLTQAYEEERYGAVPPTPDRFAHAQAAAQRIVATFGNFVRPRR